MSFERAILNHMPEVETREPRDGFVIFDPATDKYLSEEMDTKKIHKWKWFDLPQYVLFTGIVFEDIPEDPLEDRMLEFARNMHPISLRDCMLLPAIMYVNHVNIGYIEIYVKVDFINAFNFLKTARNSSKL